MRTHPVRLCSTAVGACLLLAIGSGCARDRDGDGRRGGDDCDDADPSIHRAAVEVCDGKDNDCDGRVDVDATDAPGWYADRDGDGLGTGAPLLACEAPPGRVAGGGDCDDADPDRYPGAEDLPADGVDSDCDGVDPRPELPAVLARAQALIHAQGYSGELVLAGVGCCEPPTLAGKRSEQTLELDVPAFRWYTRLTSDRFVGGGWRLTGELSCWSFPDADARAGATEAIASYRDWLVDDRVFKMPARTWAAGASSCVIAYPSPNRSPVADEVISALRQAHQGDP